LQLAGGIFITLFWLILTVSLVLRNGIHSASLLAYVVVFIFANILFGRRIVMFFTVLCCVSTLMIAIGQSQALLPVVVTPLALPDRLIVSVFVFGVTGILSSFASAALYQSLVRLRANETLLEARNRELEIFAANLAASEERYRLLFDNASVQAAVYDSSGHFVLVNEAAAKAIGKPRDSIEGYPIGEILPPEITEPILQMNQQVLSSGQMKTNACNYAFLPRPPTYSLRHLIPLPPMYANSPENRLILELTTDLTDQKRAMEREQELQAAQEKLTFFTEFFETVSHDLKTPLTVMSTGLYLLELLNDTELKHQKINQFRVQIKIMDQYIADMLMISRLEHIPTLDKGIVDLKALISSIIQSFKPTLERKGIDCQLQVPDRQLVTTADEMQLHRVFTNLIENAINYTPNNGQVFITLRQQNGEVFIEVRDTGIGIQAQDIPHIFEKFYRSAEAKSMLSSGPGLGLAIVKKILDLHQASISVQSDPKHGTSFRVLLPTA
jgi:PAS domain S-box-containing protein